MPPGFVVPAVVVEGPDPTPEELDAQDVEQNKAAAILGYLIFLLPLVFAANSRYARYHANQALLVFICGWTFGVLLWGLSLAHGLWFAGWNEGWPWIYRAFYWLVWLVWVAGLIGLAIAGMLNAASGVKKPLPVIGRVTLIKPE